MISNSFDNILKVSCCLWNTWNLPNKSFRRSWKRKKFLLLCSRCWTIICVFTRLSESVSMIILKDITIGSPLSYPNATIVLQTRQARAIRENLNHVTLAPQARKSGEILNYSLSRSSDILSMIIGEEGAVWLQSCLHLIVRSRAELIIVHPNLCDNTGELCPALARSASQTRKLQI